MRSQEISRPLVVAGPCMAESYDLMAEVAERIASLGKALDFDYVFKASFDKANRTSIDSYRGPGLEKSLEWFDKIKRTFGLRVLTDIHETNQVKPVAEVVDILQIPAFLCRQTDLVVAAVETGRDVNIKKGQFMAPQAMKNIADKAKASLSKFNKNGTIYLTERGASFGYGNLVVDMRSFGIMAQNNLPLLFDITHSTQLPSAGADGKTSGADRRFAPLLARAATATGYLSGFFLESHPNPKLAKSDADAQLSLSQAEVLLKQLIPLWRESRSFKEIDQQF